MRARRLDRVAPGWSRVQIAAVFLAAAVIAAVTPHLLSVVLPPDPLRNFVAYGVAKPVAALDFKDGDGQVRSLADFTGKVVVLNLWAAWCVPCRKEMPALDRLQTSLGGRNFAVVPLSIDRGGRETVAKFYAEIGIRKLPVYTDTSGDALRALGAVGLPTTLVLDRAGQEIARIVGPAEWDAPEVVEFLKAIIAKQAAAVLNPVSGLVHKAALLDRTDLHQTRGVWD
jgi:thiol-disulfide isomerase/thioredoxin